MSSDLKGFEIMHYDYSGGRENPSELTVMVGVSGSGKSVVAKRWVKDGGGNVVRFNRDSLRLMLYGEELKWSHYCEQVTQKYEQDGVRLALQMGRNAIVDDTCTSWRVRSDWENIAKECRVKFKLVKMTTPLDVCIERDSKRLGKECVGRGVIERQSKELGERAVRPVGYGLDAPSIFPSPTLNQAEKCLETIREGKFILRLPKAKLVLCDVDGTLADPGGDLICDKCSVETVEIGKSKSTRRCPQCGTITGRSPFDETRVILDKPYSLVVDWVRYLHPFYNIVVVSGRHSTCSDDTCAWLEAQGVPFDHILMRRGSPPDNRSDVIVKKEILNALLEVVPIEQIALVLDDRPKVVRGWQEAGLLVLPVRGQIDEF